MIDTSSLYVRNSHRSSEQTAWTIFGVGLLIFYSTTFYSLFKGIWLTEQQGHGPIVFGIAVWLIYRRWKDIATSETDPNYFIGWPIFILGVLMFVLGRSQDIITFEIGSLVFILTAALILLKGIQSIRPIWFGLFFMLFIVPLPAPLVDTLTQPMKLAVSYVAEQLLFTLGYPISRTGVILQVGQYQLLVADACAGLHTLFTLEALGLLYLNLVKHISIFRNITLALLIVPISFIANVLRVVVLCLITFHLGDSAGQGFLHSFAGMLLFMAALSLIICVDYFLRFISTSEQKLSIESRKV